MKRAEFFISGVVQGVGFRYFVYKIANSLYLNGYAKNHADGRVQVVVEGKEEAIKKLHNQLKLGPSFSRVDKVHVHLTESINEFNRFDIY